jgi:hypothetical protein
MIGQTLFFILEHKSPVTTPSEIIADPLKAAADDIQRETSKSATVEITPSEIKDKKNKLIQKETMETGSVSFLCYFH